MEHHFLEYPHLEQSRVVITMLFVKMGQEKNETPTMRMRVAMGKKTMMMKKMIVEKTVKVAKRIVTTMVLTKTANRKSPIVMTMVKRVMGERLPTNKVQCHQIVDETNE